jgi:hypothetical protein
VATCCKQELCSWGKRSFLGNNTWHVNVVTREKLLEKVLSLRSAPRLRKVSVLLCDLLHLESQMKAREMKFEVGSWKPGRTGANSWRKYW